MTSLCCDQEAFFLKGTLSPELRPPHFLLLLRIRCRDRGPLQSWLAFSLKKRALSPCFASTPLLLFSWIPKHQLLGTCASSTAESRIIFFWLNNNSVTTTDWLIRPVGTTAIRLFELLKCKLWISWHFQADGKNNVIFWPYENCLQLLPCCRTPPSS